MKCVGSVKWRWGIGFFKRMIHKITWVSRIGEGMGDKALMDYVLISSKDKERLLDVNVLR